MRQDVMLYYNDQIIENLIKARNNLPFVHVDIQSLTSAGASAVSGSVGYGETITNTGTHTQTNQTTTTNTSSPPGAPATTQVVAKIAGGLIATATHAALRPFSYSVTPTRSETLTFTAGPALGSAALVSPTPFPAPTTAPSGSPTPIPSPTLTPTERTTTTWPEGKQQVVKETLTAAPTPGTITIYDLYEDFAKNHLSHNPTEPRKGDYLPGTLKRWRRVPGTPQKYDEEYYFVAKKDVNDYYIFCKRLFTKAAGGSLEQKVQELTGRVNTLNATPIPP